MMDWVKKKFELGSNIVFITNRYWIPKYYDDYDKSRLFKELHAIGTKCKF